MPKKLSTQAKKKSTKLLSPQERGRKGGKAAQRSSKVHRLTDEERARGGKRSRQKLR